MVTVFSEEWRKIGIDEGVLFLFNERNILCYIGIQRIINTSFDYWFQKIKKQARLVNRPDYSKDPIEANFRHGDVLIDVASYRKSPKVVHVKYQSLEFFNRHKKLIKG